MPTKFNINELVRKGPKVASDRSDLNDMLGQQPETSFLQKPSPTPKPKPQSTPKPTKQYPV